MMKQGGISEEKLWACLSRLGVEAEKIHSTFGNPKKLITTDFCNQMYLEREKVTVGDKHSITYRWGPRARVEVNKEEMLEFVAEIYGGNIEQWKRQFIDILQ